MEMDYAFIAIGSFTKVRFKNMVRLYKGKQVQMLQHTYRKFTKLIFKIVSKGAQDCNLNI